MKQQQGFALFELISMIFFLMHFTVTDNELGPIMIALSLMAMYFNSASTMEPR
jgi:hypothetical protein